MPPGVTNVVPTARAKPGDIITLYGIGFGTVSPNINAGVIVGQANSLSGLQVFIGGQQATVQFAGLVQGFLGLYQFNVVVPNVAANDATPLTFMLNGAPGNSIADPGNWELKTINGNRCRAPYSNLSEYPGRRTTQPAFIPQPVMRLFSTTLPGPARGVACRDQVDAGFKNARVRGGVIALVVGDVLIAMRRVEIEQQVARDKVASRR